MEVPARILSAPCRLNWRARKVQRLVLVTTIFICLVFLPTSNYYYPTLNFGSSPRQDSPHIECPWQPKVSHPIHDLIRQACHAHDQLLEHPSLDLKTAAASYRQRRHRHPPPGFDVWFAYALKHDAIVIESFFDRIHVDIAPFWALDPRLIAQRAASWPHALHVRNGVVATVTENAHKGDAPWLQLWSDLVHEAAPHLPDVDIPVNSLDEARVTISWEDRDRYMHYEESHRSLLAPDEVTTRYMGLNIKEETPSLSMANEIFERNTTNAWDITRAACHPTSPSRNASQLDDFLVAPEFPPETTPQPLWKYQGYVQDVDASRDPCIQPHLRSLHGTLIQPSTMKMSRELIPVFSGCKLSTNNDILIPGAMYLEGTTPWAAKNHAAHRVVPWETKTKVLVWRGLPTGGTNTAENWRHFQRARLVEMLNGTVLSLAEQQQQQQPQQGQQPLTFPFPLPSPRNLNSSSYSSYPRGGLGPWLTSLANVGFTNFLCSGPQGTVDYDCDFLRDSFARVETLDMYQEQLQQYKFLPDVDGNSYSGRYRDILLSPSSLPIKGTLYREWHDDRLVPWLHYVPMDNTFVDMYGILDFLTTPDEEGDRAGRFIAEMGGRWAAKVLRREDMLLYTWRVLLEFARVCDEKRESLGFVGDLLGKGAG